MASACDTPELILRNHENLKSFISAVLDAFQKGSGWDGWNKRPIDLETAKALIWNEVDRRFCAASGSPTFARLRVALPAEVGSVGLLIAIEESVVFAGTPVVAVQCLGARPVPHDVGTIYVPPPTLEAALNPMMPTVAQQAAEGEAVAYLVVRVEMAEIKKLHALIERLIATGCTVRDWSLF